MIRFRLRHALATLTLALALAAAGCGGAQPASPTPTAPPPTPSDEAAKPARTVLADAASAAAALHGLHVAFKGIDGNGEVAFDVTADGRGGLSGTFTKGAAQGDIVVTGSTLYVRGRDLVTALDGQVLPAAYDGRWVEYRTKAPGGMLDTVRQADLLARCLGSSTTAVSGQGATQLGPRRVVGVDARAGSAAGAWHVQLAVARDGAPVPVRIVVLASDDPPTSCTGGAANDGSDASRPGAGTVGTFDITPLTNVPPVATPADVLPMPPSGP